MNTQTRTLLAGLLTLFGAAWLHVFLATTFPENAAALWIMAYMEFLTGSMDLFKSLVSCLFISVSYFIAYKFFDYRIF